MTDGCHQNLWLTLAQKREATHLHEVTPIYQEQIEPILALKNNDAYAQTIRYLKKIKRLMTKLNRQQAFKDYLALICQHHKAKRNFMKLVQEEKWM